MLSKITSPIAALIIGLAAIVSVVFVGVPMWGIVKGYVPPSFLFMPLGTVLLAVATGIAAYVKGKNELPGWFTDPEVKKVIADSLRPAPLIGSTSFPPSYGVPRAPSLQELEGVEIKVDP